MRVRSLYLFHGCICTSKPLRPQTLYLSLVPHTSKTSTKGEKEREREEIVDSIVHAQLIRLLPKRGFSSLVQKNVVQSYER